MRTASSQPQTETLAAADQGGGEGGIGAIVNEGTSLAVKQQTLNSVKLVRVILLNSILFIVHRFKRSQCCISICYTLYIVAVLAAEVVALLYEIALP